MRTSAAMTTSELDHEIAALRDAVEAELGISRPRRARDRRRRRHLRRPHLRRLIWRARKEGDVVVAYVAALVLSVVVAFLVVYLTSGE